MIYLWDFKNSKHKQSKFFNCFLIRKSLLMQQRKDIFYISIKSFISVLNEDMSEDMSDI